MTDIRKTIEDISKFSPELARQVNSYIKDHSYGLVFERHLPEATRYYKRRPQRGNTVNILPERGHTETAENKIPWIVDNIRNGRVIVHYKDEQRELPIEDVVVVAGHDDVIYPGLKVIDKVERGNADDPYHMVINAENYHALEMLSYAYTGKVDCIYIDPPYNTGAKDWKYNNNYVGQDDQYRHSKWLSFMERRLKLAKQLLNPKDSALIVTIDEKEYLRLGMLLEQMFPEARIQMVSSVINRHGTSRTDELSRTNEFIYIVRFGNCGIQPLRDKTYISEGAEIHWQSFRRSNPANVRAVTSTQFYPIYVDIKTSTIKKIGNSLPKDMKVEDVDPMEGCETVLPIRDDGTEMMWGAVPKECKARLEKGYVRVGAHTPDKNQKYAISFLMSGTIKDIEAGNIIIDGRNKDGSVKGHYVSVKKSIPTTQWSFDSHDACDYGTKILKRMLPDRKFPYPKSLYAVEECIRLFVANKPNALIVDFFAGSGTTAHATMLLNHLDGGHRRCISVTNNEVSAEEEKKFIKAGLRPYDEEWQKYGIARYITWERVKAAITGTNTLGEPIKGDYKFTEEFPMSEGFKENAIFCELTYESEWDVRLDYAFDAIAPILWMQAGCRGGIITKIGKTFRYTDNYAVLFDYSQASNFVKAVKEHPSIRTVYIVTDDQRRFSNMCNRLRGRNIEVYRLYKTYLETFRIFGEGHSF